MKLFAMSRGTHWIIQIKIIVIGRRILADWNFSPMLKHVNKILNFLMDIVSNRVFFYSTVITSCRTLKKQQMRAIIIAIWSAIPTVRLFMSAQNLTWSDSKAWLFQKKAKNQIFFVPNGFRKATQSYNSQTIAFGPIRTTLCFFFKKTTHCPVIYVRYCTS